MCSLNLNKNTNYKQGFFYPKNLNKFVGKENKAIYRSGLDFEEVIVPYFFVNKCHKYHVDLFEAFKFGEKMLYEAHRCEFHILTEKYLENTPPFQRKV